VLAHLPPRAQPHQLQEILRIIQTVRPQRVSDAARSLPQAAELCKHRGIVVVLSDLFDNMDALMQGLERMRFHNHEVILFHLWDLWERRMPLEGHCKFHDLETGDVLMTQADGVRESYLAEVQRWCDELESQCRNRAVDRVELTTDEPLDKALLDYLVKRAKSY
jgi:uncharacterized protein (DUF58 family)